MTTGVTLSFILGFEQRNESALVKHVFLVEKCVLLCTCTLRTIARVYWCKSRKVAHYKRSLREVKNDNCNMCCDY